MKKLLLCGAIAAGCCLVSTAQNKINNAGIVQLEKFRFMQEEMAKTSPMRAAAMNQNVTVYATLNDGYTTDDLEAFGVTVLDSTADMAIISLPITQVELLANEDMIKSISFGYQAAPMMDQARTLSFADGVHDGSAEGLSRGYRGAGVYVGLYDTGLDPNHINFTDANGVSRVKAVYLAKSGSVSAYDTPADIANFTTDDRSESHGTHVLGSITGRNTLTGTYATREGASTKIYDGTIPYYGLAPDADILVGCGSFDDASINAGIGRIVDRAKSEGRPVIINLSLGHNRGSHDPRETVNRYLDSRAQDAIIVVSAGNEGGTQMSIEREFTSTAALKTSIVPSNDARNFIYYTAEFWGNSNTPFEADIVLYDKVQRKEIKTYSITTTTGSMVWTPDNNDVMAANFTASSEIRASWGIDSDTKRFNIYMNNSTQATGSDVVLGIVIYPYKGLRLNGYCDAINGYSADEVRFASQTGWTRSVTGTDIGSINGMACGYNTVSVGAWVSRTTVPQLSGGQYAYNAGDGVGSIAGFSSYGKSGDGRQLPIVVGPGAQIVSSVSRYWVNSRNVGEPSWSAKVTSGDQSYPWYFMQGTSMSSPFVAGTLALWLEAFPEMRFAEVKQILEKTSTKDSYTATDPDRWGTGKINVLGGLQEAIRMSASIDGVLEDKADSNLMITDLGGKQYEVCCPGLTGLSCSVYNLQGSNVAAAVTDGDTLTLDASGLQSGIYVLTTNAAGQNISRKIVIK